MSDPASFPSEAIQRVLFICSKVHVYNIPPLASNKGYTATSWTENNNARQIFTARLRILETAIPPPPSSPSGTTEKLSVEVLMEDPATGDLFAGAPYTDKHVVEAAIDSSRFFAVRVVGEGGMKATLGIGFEERSEAIDFGICLQECRKILGHEVAAPGLGKAAGKTGKPGKQEQVEKRDWSLKEGETIRVDIGRKGRRKEGQSSEDTSNGSQNDNKALFSIKPPPGNASNVGGSIPTLAPPPNVPETRADKRRSRGLSPGKLNAKDLGFDDGEFGEFQ